MHPVRLPNRLHDYDYSRNALYFITSCIHDRVCSFGEIKDSQMFLSEYGKVAERQWQWLEQKYPYIVLHSFIVMPNHIHGVIEIDDRRINKDSPLYENNNCKVETDYVGTGRDLSLHNLASQQQEQQLNYNGVNQSIIPEQKTKIKSLSELISAYKTTTSKQIHLLGLQDFKWQRLFHDHIIRNEESYLRISSYIENNPFNWKEDKFYY